MAFYDAYKGNVAAVGVPTLNPAGNAAKSFGDAFANFGRTLRGVEADRKKQERIDLDTEIVQEDRAFRNKEREQAAANDSLMAAFSDYETPAEYQQNVDGLDNASAEVRQKMDAHYQGRFNDEAVKTSITGDYESFDAFKDGNPMLVQNADGVTMAKIEKYFADKDRRVAEAQGAEEKANTARKLLEMQGRLVKAQSGKGGFQYDEQTDAKIAAQVKTAMGMDAPDFSFTDAKMKEYQDAVAGSANISKTYNLEPSLAIHVYANPELYEFTADGKVLVRDVPKVPEPAKASSSWKDYAPAGVNIK